jgi:cytochrome c oxidase subunit 2
MARFQTLLMAIAWMAAATRTSPAQDRDRPVEFKITARRYSFEPGEIKVPCGTKVRLLITAEDREHGFNLDAFQIKRDLPKGETITVEFTANRTGIFPYRCWHVCGLGHGKMKGALIVE